jgi:hypothetical protein
LERIDGFIDNIRYGSLRREGWLLSLSNWRDEKSLIRWRTLGVHHGVQEKGRFEVFRDYHLRVGEMIRDTGLAAGQGLPEQRLDETEIGAATRLTIIDAKRPAHLPKESSAEQVAAWLGLPRDADGLVGWDVYDAILTPGDLVLLLSWRDDKAAEAGDAKAARPEGSRLRRIRVVRDYGMFDRREAPQYYAEVKR